MLRAGHMERDTEEIWSTVGRHLPPLGGAPPVGQCPMTGGLVRGGGAACRRGHAAWQRRGWDGLAQAEILGGSVLRRISDLGAKERQ